jgi:hypothetical protein
MSCDDVLPTIRRKVCHCIAQVANALCYVEAEDGSTTQVPEELGNKEWAELIPTIVEIAKSQNNCTRELAYFAFSQMADYVGEGMRPYQQPACEFITAGLNDACADVRLAALRSMTAYLVVLESPAEQEPFEALIPKLLQMISAALCDDGEELWAQEALQALLEIADVQSNFLCKNLVPVGDVLLIIAGTEDLDTWTRQLGLEILVTLAERSGGMMCEQEHLINGAIKMAAMFICDVEEDEEWASREELEGTFGDLQRQEGDELSAFGEQALDRLSVALGGDAVMPMTRAIIEELLSNMDEWKQRRAAFQMLAVVGEGCADDLKTQIAAVVGMVLPSFDDPHPRVRYAAIHCIGHLAVDFAGELHRVAYDEVVAAIKAAMGDQNALCPRVQLHAASALIKFCHPEYCEPGMLTDHVEPLLENLLSLVSAYTSVSAQTLLFTAVESLVNVVGTRSFNELAGGHCRRTFVQLAWKYIFPEVSMFSRAFKLRMLQCLASVNNTENVEIDRPISFSDEMTSIFVGADSFEQLIGAVQKARSDVDALTIRKAEEQRIERKRNEDAEMEEADKILESSGFVAWAAEQLDSHGVMGLHRPDGRVRGRNRKRRGDSNQGSHYDAESDAAKARIKISFDRQFNTIAIRDKVAGAICRASKQHQYTNLGKIVLEFKMKKTGYAEFQRLLGSEEGVAQIAAIAAMDSTNAAYPKYLGPFCKRHAAEAKFQRLLGSEEGLVRIAAIAAMDSTHDAWPAYLGPLCKDYAAKLLVKTMNDEDVMNAATSKDENVGLLAEKRGQKYLRQKMCFVLEKQYSKKFAEKAGRAAASEEKVEADEVASRSIPNIERRVQGALGVLHNLIKECPQVVANLGKSEEKLRYECRATLEYFLVWNNWLKGAAQPTTIDELHALFSTNSIPNMIPVATQQAEAEAALAAWKLAADHEDGVLAGLEAEGHARRFKITRRLADGAGRTVVLCKLAPVYTAKNDAGRAGSRVHAPPCVAGNPLQDAPRFHLGNCVLCAGGDEGVAGNDGNRGDGAIYEEDPNLKCKTGRRFVNVLNILRARGKAALVDAADGAGGGGGANRGGRVGSGVVVDSLVALDLLLSSPLSAKLGSNACVLDSSLKLLESLAPGFIDEAAGALATLPSEKTVLLVAHRHSPGGVLSYTNSRPFAASRQAGILTIRVPHLCAYRGTDDEWVAGVEAAIVMAEEAGL